MSGLGSVSELDRVVDAWLVWFFMGMMCLAAVFAVAWIVTPDAPDGLQDSCRRICAHQGLYGVLSFHGDEIQCECLIIQASHSLLVDTGRRP
jgi:hypothetical protein